MKNTQSPSNIVRTLSSGYRASVVWFNTAGLCMSCHVGVLLRLSIIFRPGFKRLIGLIFSHLSGGLFGFDNDIIKAWFIYEGKLPF